MLLPKELSPNSTRPPDPAPHRRGGDAAATVIPLPPHAPTPHGAARWAVVGGGMLGMTVALRLAEAGKSVTLYEAAESLGGLAGAWQLDDIVWDRHYHVTLLSDTALRRLLAELGIEREMHWAETRTGFYTGGRLLSMSNAFEFLRFPPLNLIDKLRLAATIIYASRLRDPLPLEQIPVADWLRRLSGPRTFERVWLPLLRAKLGESYRETSAAFIWATIARMYAARRTGLKREMFGYVAGGYGRVLGRFAEVLLAKGVGQRCGLSAKKVCEEREGKSESGGRIRIEFGDGSAETFDGVVLTVPSSVAARVCEGLTEDEHARFSSVKYQGIICVSLLLRKPLANFYVTNITDPGIPFTAVIEMSALVNREHFGGRALVYLPKYVAPDDPAFALTDEELKRQFLPALKRMYPAFDEADLFCFQVSRVRHVFPLPTLGYSERLPPTATTIPGLYVVNSAHITNGTLNVNETVQLAERFTAQLLASPDTQKRHEAGVSGGAVSCGTAAATAGRIAAEGAAS